MVHSNDIERQLSTNSNQRCLIIAGKLKLIIPIPMSCFCDCELAIGLQSLHMHLTEHWAIMYKFSYNVLFKTPKKRGTPAILGPLPKTWGAWRPPGSDAYDSDLLVSSSYFQTNVRNSIIRCHTYVLTRPKVIKTPPMVTRIFPV